MTKQELEQICQDLIDNNEQEYTFSEYVSPKFLLDNMITENEWNFYSCDYTWDVHFVYKDVEFNVYGNSYEGWTLLERNTDEEL